MVCLLYRGCTLLCCFFCVLWMLSECYRCFYVYFSAVYCVYLTVFVNFASGSIAVLCSEVPKWVSLSVMLKLLFALRGAWEKKYIAKRTLLLSSLWQYTFLSPVDKEELKNDTRYLHTGLMLLRWCIQEVIHLSFLCILKNRMFTQYFSSTSHWSHSWSSFLFIRIWIFFLGWVWVCLTVIELYSLKNHNTSTNTSIL